MVPCLKKQRNRMSIAQKERFMNEEERRKLSERQTLRMSDEINRQKISALLSARFSSEEEKIRISQSQKKRFERDDERKKISDFNLCRFQDTAELKKLSDAKRHKMKPVLQITMSGEVVNEYESISAASKSATIQPCHISRCCRGIEKSAGGFHWKYKNA